MSSACVGPNSGVAVDHPQTHRAGRPSAPLGDDRARPAVIADGEVTPVGQQRFAVGAEQPAEVRGVVERRVEVDVVADLDRQPHRQSVAPLDGVGRTTRRGTIAEQIDQHGAHRPPAVPPFGEKVVQSPGGETTIGQDPVEHAEIGQACEVERVVADRDPGAHRAIAEPTGPEREVAQRER